MRKMTLKAVPFLAAALCLLFPAGSLAAQPGRVAKDPNVILGTVYADLNGNGEQDEGEPGLAGVAVSDEFSEILTDGDGYFALRIRPESHYLRFTLPDGYRLRETLCLDLSRWENRQIRHLKVAALPENRRERCAGGDCGR